MSKLVGVSEIQEMIIELRGKKVIIDSDVAILYQVSTKRLIVVSASIVGSSL